MGGRYPGLFLDRDGVINYDIGYLHRIEECRFIDGIFDLVRDCRRSGYSVVVITNQAGIGRGYFGEDDFAKLTAFMSGVFVDECAQIDAFYHCPYHPTHGIGEYRREHPWRKPAPGMILQAVEDLDLDLSRSWLVGDKKSDIEAGLAAGVGTLVQLDRAAALVGAQANGDFWRASSLGAIRQLFNEMNGSSS